MNEQINVNVKPEVINSLVEKFKEYVIAQIKFGEVVDSHVISDLLLNDDNSFYNVYSSLIETQTFRINVLTNSTLKSLGMPYNHLYDDAISDFEKK